MSFCTGTCPGEKKRVKNTQIVSSLALVFIERIQLFVGVSSCQPVIQPSSQFVRWSVRQSVSGLWSVGPSVRGLSGGLG